MIECSSPDPDVTQDTPTQAEAILLGIRTAASLIEKRAQAYEGPVADAFLDAARWLRAKAGRRLK
jgi:hypothetical protein